MKKLILMLAFCASVSGAYAQKTVKVEKVQQYLVTMLTILKDLVS